MMAARLIYVTDEEFDVLGRYLNMAGPNYDSISLNDKILFMRDKFKETEMPTKHIMTRAEAAIMLRNKVFGVTDTGQAMKWVDFFIDTGMLEIKEEEEKPGLPIGFSFPFAKLEEWTNCCNELFEQGFKIVPK